jgi:hypothetical protein
MNRKKTRLHKMLESENSLTRSLGNLTVNIIKATGAEKRTKEKLEKIENNQIEQLNNLIDALSKHVIKYKICERHLKKYILGNKHQFLGREDFFNEKKSKFIKQFNEFSRILKIYKGFCQYLDPKKLESYVMLMLNDNLNNINFKKYKDDFLIPKRSPICDLSLEDSSEESSEVCTTTFTDSSSDVPSDVPSDVSSSDVSSDSSSDIYSPIELKVSRSSDWGRQTNNAIFNIQSNDNSNQSSNSVS